MSKVDLVICVVELHREAKCEQRYLKCIPFLLARVVLDIVACSAPPKQTGLRFLLRVEQWAHPMRVKRVRLNQVDYVEFVCLGFPCVRYPEVEPLGELAGRAMVEPQLEVVFEVSDLSGFM